MINFLQLFEEVLAFSYGLPVIVLPEHAYGGTGYIDGLRPEDMPADIAMGCDRTGRRFFAFRMLARIRGEDVMVVETIFERYSPTPGSPKVLVSGGPGFICNTAMTEEDLEVLRSLLSGATRGRRSWHTVDGSQVRREEGKVVRFHGAKLAAGSA